jgi:hypothetical protein
LASELCQTVGDEFFLTLHSFLEVGKTQDLPSKFWQTLGDALTTDLFFKNVRYEVEIRQGQQFVFHRFLRAPVVLVTEVHQWKVEDFKKKKNFTRLPAHGRPDWY